MTTALIVGGGIAGTATAIALRTVGVSSVICEAYPSGGEDTGAFLTVMHNGMAALHQIEADRAVIDASYPANGVSLLDASGSQLEQRRIDPPGRTLTRAALYRVLQDEAARRGVRIDRGRRLVDATAGDGGVRASFADGSAVQGDLLVGADGLHSVVRGLIDRDAPRPRYTGQHVVYGYATGGRGHTAPDAYHMVFGSRAFFGYTTPPDGRTWWFARLDATELTQRMRPEHWRHRVLDAFRDDSGPAAEIVAATGDDIVGSNSYDIPTTPKWHNGSMVLAGDAAHAASPAAAQGASMALEDAVALARCLGAHGDLRKAFDAYESLRREPTEETVAASSRMSNGGTRSPTGPS
ncbi:FAD-dependent monooxygenase [Salinispora arenicola]|uniref:FAD-dependent monooxygenase n=1 Tax=Salinispora arenicola TaxID=168697 RepID=UPI0003703FD2|nr:FAD-dependent monooxygenase [Salinispora arenicola]